MTFLEFCGYGLAGLVLLYLGARLISAAFFKSKQQYESEKS